MKNTGKSRKCSFCHTIFNPDRYNIHVQEFCCHSRECRKASSRASSKKYREKKRGDLEWKKNECERVKRYQREHPGYWKKQKKPGKNFPDLFLRDFAQAQKTADFPLLRDFVFYFGTCLTGFIAHTSDWGDDLLLRDFIGSLLNRFYDKGIALSSEGNINLSKEDFNHDPKRSRKPGAPEAHAGRVRLGGSQPSQARSYKR